MTTGRVIKIVEIKCKQCGEYFRPAYDWLSKSPDLCGHCSEENIRDAFGYDGDVL